MFRYFPALIVLLALLTMAGCAPLAVPPAPTAASCPASAACPVCPLCPPVVPPKPAERPLQEADWNELPGWNDDDPGIVFGALLASCRSLERQAQWQPVCTSARSVEDKSATALRAWFEAQFRPWALVNPDGSRTGLITGYYEPILKGSRQQSRGYAHPVFGPPEDMIVVELAELYPELKHLRLRGRVEGRKLVPYYSRAEWTPQESKRSPEALLWIDDAIDLFFMQIQGSGQVQLADGSRVRLNYADQNGHPYRSIGRWLIERGELKAEQASMQGIKAWAKANPARLAELLNANPSLVFFRELPVEGSGPQGAMGLALTPERSLAIDPRHVPLGAPIWLATTRPNSEQALTRLMLGQDTGGAIRGVVRADFYWGSGSDAGNQAGKMRQQGRMWVLMPRGYEPPTGANSAPK
ncbi:murein transglycosylase A [Sulfuritalea hydrogenivorans]|uniref:peptidoglycan lytic exotransglycosylase n=1 Tax=Sulfuritalea hydrogenivorans sk43H TaxID=1223802 RepID=W0SAG7_9PROT|nr:murein transglycosylase A [Sulfuritalea hydrogenivorans]BAO27847.1 membrane-bound lytic murein transglycosylase A [Sulfuritalea hydrogenivorans sk43H]